MRFNVSDILNRLAKDANGFLSAKEDAEVLRKAQRAANLVRAKEFGGDVINFVNALNNIPPTANGTKFKTYVLEDYHNPSGSYDLHIGLANIDRFHKERKSEINLSIDSQSISCEYSTRGRSNPDSADPKTDTQSPQEAIEFILTWLIHMEPQLCQNAGKAIPAPGRSGPGGMT